MKSISGTIANTLWTQGIIQEEDIDTCKYGLDVFISSALEIVSILVIAAFVGNFFQAVLLFTAFIPAMMPEAADSMYPSTPVICPAKNKFGFFCMEKSARSTSGD